jgi:hypothetical protein
MNGKIHPTSGVDGCSHAESAGHFRTPAGHRSSTDSESLLTAKQEEGIIALLSHPTVRKAAEHLGVDEKTVHRWLDQPGFCAAYRKARRDAFAQAMSASQRYAPTALKALADIVADEAKPCAARVSAASAILKFSRESLELDDLAARLDAVEAKIHGDEPRLESR